jgi:Arc/MetJ-type ribon-helix-helix transcriptional regulator
MTEPRKINRKVSENQEVVTFRLPTDLLEKLDRLVDEEQSSRTAIIRRALALYHRMPGGVFVPTAQKTRDKLRTLFLRRDDKPAETVLQELLSKAVDHEYDQAMQVIQVQGSYRISPSLVQRSRKELIAYTTLHS